MILSRRVPSLGPAASLPTPGKAAGKAKSCRPGWVAAFFLALAAPAWAQTTGKYPEIEYAFPDQSVWTTRLNERGEPDNPLLRVASALFAKAGIPWHGAAYPSARMFKYLQDGQAQFSMLVKAPVLQDCCLWSRKPVAAAEIRVYRRGGQPPVKTKEELAGKSLITVRGYSYGALKEFLADEKNRIAIQEAPTHGAAFRMLAGGRGDYLMDYAGPAGEVLAAEPIAGLQYDSLSRQDVYLVLHKGYPEAAAVMARLETVAESLELPLKGLGK